MRPEKKRDVGEVNLDPEVHGFVSNNNMVQPIPNARRNDPYLPNGSDPSAHPSNFAFRPTKLRDIGE